MNKYKLVTKNNIEFRVTTEKEQTLQEVLNIVNEARKNNDYIKIGEGMAVMANEIVGIVKDE